MLGYCVIKVSFEPARKAEMTTHWLFANFLASRAFAPIPGAWFVGTLAACAGLCIGWMGVPAGESLGVVVADMVAR